MTDLRSLARLSGAQSRSISPENFDGAKGAGARAEAGTGAACAADLGVGWKVSPSVEIGGRTTFELAAIDGPGLITHLWLTTHHGNWRSLILRAYWDGADQPAIEVPLGDFFGQGWCEFAQLSSLPIAVNPHGGFNSYWPMPVPRHARLTLENRAPRTAVVYYQISYEIDVDFTTEMADTGYLLDMSMTGEIVALPEIAPVPWTKPWFRGLANVRGRLVGVVDLMLMSGRPPMTAEDSLQLVVMGDVLKVNAALVATRAFGLRNLKDLQPLGTLSDPARPWELERFREADGTTLIELDLRRLVTTEQFSAIGI